MHTLNIQVRGRLIPELRINGARLYLDPIKEPDLNPDEIDEEERVIVPARRRCIIRWHS